jgi:hypothetical protein
MTKAGASMMGGLFAVQQWIVKEKGLLK